MAPRIGVASSTGVGLDAGGRDRNEDNYLLCVGGQVRYLEDDEERVSDRRGEGVVVAVCDGMGGHSDGHLASLTAVKVLSRLYQEGLPPNPERALLRYVRDSHATLHWKMAEMGAVTMGTTVTVAWLLHGTLSFVNVGDSRLYRFRDQTLELLTLDQTRNEFARRDEGTQIEGDEDHLAQSFIYGSRGLGDNSTLRLELGLDTGTIPFEAGDVFLLTTDGVHGVLEADQIERLLARIVDPQGCADALVENAMAAGSTDNLTAIVLQVTERAPPTVEWTDDFDVLKTL